MYQNLSLKYLLLSLFITFCTASLSAQINPSLISPTGMYKKDANQNTHLVSIGEIAITTLSNDSNSLTQGFLQPFDIFLVNTNPDPVYNLDINIYPNPTSSFVRLDLSNLNTNELLISITDELGRIIHSEKIATNKGQSSFELNVANWSSGTYFIRAIDQQQVRTAALKFVKI